MKYFQQNLYSRMLVLVIFAKYFQPMCLHSGQLELAVWKIVSVIFTSQTIQLVAFGNHFSSIYIQDNHDLHFGK